MPQICIYLLGLWEKSEIRIIPKLCPPCPLLRLKVGGGHVAPGPMVAPPMSACHSTLTSGYIWHTYIWNTWHDIALALTSTAWLNWTNLLSFGILSIYKRCAYPVESKINSDFLWPFMQPVILSISTVRYRVVKCHTISLSASAALLWIDAETPRRCHLMLTRLPTAAGRHPCRQRNAGLARDKRALDMHMK